MDRTVSCDTQVYVFLKRIGGHHFDTRRYTSNIRGHDAWSIDQSTKAIIRGTHFLLMTEDRRYPILRLLFQPFVIQGKSQWNQTIQPVWAVLPSFSLSSNPRAVGNIRPELIKVTGQSIGLNAQLRVQPFRWTHAPQRQHQKSILNQSKSRFRFFRHAHTSIPFVDPSVPVYFVQEGQPRFHPFPGRLDVMALSYHRERGMAATFLRAVHIISYS